MNYQGKGSKESPIAIDDSEDEVVSELHQRNGHYLSSSPISPNNRPSLQERITTASLFIENGDSEVVEFGTLTTGKRKRSESDAQHSVPTLHYRYQYTEGSTSSQSIQQLSKKARKRQRRAEREAEEAKEAQKAQPSSSIPSQSPIHSSFHQLPAKPLWAQKQRLYTGDTIREPDRHHNSVTSPISSSAWLPSKSQTGETPVPSDGSSTQKSSPAQEWPPSTPTINEVFPYPNPPKSLPVGLTKQISSSGATASSSKGKYSTTGSGGLYPRIGMDPEQDPESRHGLFNLPKTNPSAGSSTGPPQPYLPNPACTLVLEQLPKQNRNKEFLHSWSRKACGALPANVLIDGHAAKALLEYSSTELARKAWASPKLGQALVGLPTHLLKGKARVDQIKAWWYRVQGIGADSGVGEIEEGEIAGDDVGHTTAQDRSSEAAKHKESKKERKARLARERAEKEEQDRAIKDASRPHNPGLPLLPQVEPSLGSEFSVPNGLPARPLPAFSWSQQMHPIEPLTMTATPIASSSTHPISHTYRLSTENRFAIPPLTTPMNEDVDLEADDMDLASPVASEANNGETLWPHSSVLNLNPLHPAIEPAQVYIEPQFPIATPVPITHSAFLPPATVHPVQPLSAPRQRVPPLSQTPSTSSSKPSTPAPSEPRAMRTAPTAPSFTKRSLLAKQKELEIEIAKQQEMISAASRGGTLSHTVGPSTPSLTPPPPPPATDPPVTKHTTLERTAMEERLRTLVMQSRINKNKAPSSTAPLLDSSNIRPPPTSGTPASDSPTHTIKPSGKLSLTATTGTLNLSVNDLAASFIAETIQAVDTIPPQTRTPVLPAVDAKTQLAARQRRLEEHIAESKILMSQLGKARTKQEKDHILAVLRERSRLMEEGDKISQLAPPSSNNFPGPGPGTAKVMSATMFRKWPESRPEDCILFLSDEEGSDDDDTA